MWPLHRRQTPFSSIQRSQRQRAVWQLGQEGARGWRLVGKGLGQNERFLETFPGLTLLQTVYAARDSVSGFIFAFDSFQVSGCWGGSLSVYAVLWHLFTSRSTQNAAEAVTKETRNLHSDGNHKAYPVFPERQRNQLFHLPATNFQYTPKMKAILQNTDTPDSL